MFQHVYACLSQDHNLELVALAALICLVASFTTISLIQRALRGQGRMRAIWLLAATLASGLGIWATHFIAMLAYDPGLPTSYDLNWTFASIAAVVAINGVGLAIVGSNWKSLRFAIGGATVGLGIGVMHFLGMRSVDVQGSLIFHTPLVLVSLASGIALAALALDRLRDTLSLSRLGQSGLLLTLAICSLHFTAMGAVKIEFNPLAAAIETTSSQEILIIGISAATLLILILSLAGAIFDQHLAKRSEDEATRLRELADAATEGIVRLLNGRITDTNFSFARLVGASPEELKGTEFHRLFINEADIHHALNADDSSSSIHELSLLSRAGEEIPVELRVKTLSFGERSLPVVTVSDLRERRQAEARIRYLAHHDGLTGLPNRTVFNDRLEHTIALSERNGDKKFAILLLDIDRFKDINDVLGHKAGDELLKEIAHRLKNCTRMSDTVSRLSGDEFAIIQDDSGQPEGAEKLAQRILAVMADPFSLLGQDHLVTTSVGIALFPQDGPGAATLVANADTALYRAKNDGRGTYRFFEAEMDKRLRERRTLDYEMRQALANGDMQIYYQPQIETETGHVCGFEALVRWHHIARGMIGPDIFIPVAEESGFIVTLGDWILEAACREAASWPQPLRIGVNLSPVQFRHGALHERVADILKRTGLHPSRLEIEITEGILIDDPLRALDTLKKLKALGVAIAMDDFGTGYSSLSYLQRFPFDKVKIDRSFIKELERSPQSVAIVKAVIGLAHALKMPVVAEGVESEGQMRLLRMEGCDEIQGFLLGYPQQIEAYEDVTGKQRLRGAG